MTKLILSSIMAVVAGLAVHPSSQSTNPHRGHHAVSSPDDIGSIAQRYIVVGARSVMNGVANTNAATVIRIVNTGAAICNYRVRFQYVNGNFSVCDADFTGVGPFGGAVFCSRSVPDATGADVAPCGSVCNPQLTQHDLKALVFSTNTDACKNMAVDAEKVFTDSTDTTVQGAQSLTTVKQDVIQLPRSNKGD